FLFKKIIFIFQFSIMLMPRQYFVKRRKLCHIERFDEENRTPEHQNCRKTFKECQSLSSERPKQIL
ncbi:hypothetical protein BpHYR1_021156, partial [Brachionus plicatilis]